MKNRLLLPVLSLSAALAGCGSAASDDNPKVETLPTAQAQQTMKAMRKPASMGGAPSASPGAGQGASAQ